MSSPIPMPLRAAAGLASIAIDEARRLPNRLVNLPVLAVGTALQVSLKAQQRYAELVIRGDELLGQLRGQRAGTPPWARFDDEEGPESESRPRSAFDSAGGPADLRTDAGQPLAEAMVAAEEDAGAEDVVDGPGPLAASQAGRRAEPDLLTVAEAGDDDALIEALAGDDAAEASDDDDRPGAAEEQIGTLADDASRYDGYLSEPPLAGYDAMSIAQLRARLRTLTQGQLRELVSYERANAGRPPYLTMLENRLNTVRGS
jgi:hypothetical protein